MAFSGLLIYGVAASSTILPPGVAESLMGWLVAPSMFLGV
jgi:hypothetical protein